MGDHDCTVVENILKPCPGLHRSLEVEGRGKGISIMELTSFKEGQGFRTSKSFAVVKSGEFKAKGVVLNYCPFCGASIAEHVKTRPEEGSSGDHPPTDA